MTQIKDPQKAVGKKIKSIDCTCANVWKIEFEDGDKMEIWGETKYIGYAGSIPVLTADIENFG